MTNEITISEQEKLVELEELESLEEVETFPEGWTPDLPIRYNAVRSRHLFPVRMWEHDRVRYPDFPRYMPWSFAAEVMPQLSVVRLRSGMSTLDVLAATGGISYKELYYKLTGVCADKKKEGEVVNHVKSAIEQYVRSNPVSLQYRTTSSL